MPLLVPRARPPDAARVRAAPVVARAAWGPTAASMQGAPWGEGRWRGMMAAGGTTAERDEAEDARVWKQARAAEATPKPGDAEATPEPRPKPAEAVQATLRRNTAGGVAVVAAAPPPSEEQRRRTAHTATWTDQETRKPLANARQPESSGPPPKKQKNATAAPPAPTPTACNIDVVGVATPGDVKRLHEAARQPNAAVALATPDSSTFVVYVEPPPAAPHEPHVDNALAASFTIGGADSEQALKRFAALLFSLLTDPKAPPIVAFGMQNVLRACLRGEHPPAWRRSFAPARLFRGVHASRARFTDPQILGWLADPARVEKGRYATAELAYGLPALVADLAPDVARVDPLALEQLGRSKRKRLPVATDVDAVQLAARTARLALRVARALAASTPPARRDALAREVSATAALAVLAEEGLDVDIAQLQTHRSGLEAAMQRIDASVRRCVDGTDAPAPAPKPADDALQPCHVHPCLHKPAELASILYERLKLTSASVSGPSGQKSVDVDALRELAARDDAHPLPALVLEYRELHKTYAMWVRADWVDKLAACARLRPLWHQYHTVTGRLSCSHPNVQQVPKSELSVRGADDAASLRVAVRDAFVARDAKRGGVLLSADYKQVELRLLAHLSNDSRMLELFKDVNADPFLSIAQTAFASQNGGAATATATPRDVAKRVCYSVLYGSGPRLLAKQLGTTVESASSCMDRFLGSFPQLRALLGRIKVHAIRQGAASLSIAGGRVRPLPDARSGSEARRLASERYAVNGLIQGSAADLLKLAQVAWFETWCSDEFAPYRAHARLIASVHDELLVEVDGGEEGAAAAAAAAAALVRAMTEEAPRKLSAAAREAMRVPFPVDLRVGSTWGSMRPYSPSAAAVSPL